MQKFVLQLAANPIAVRRARAALAPWLDGINVGEGRAADVQLIMTELVTNALIHGSSSAHLTVALDGGRLHIEVGDDQRSPPELRVPMGSGGGFGLHIVAALALDWGWNPTPGGKVVWADIAL